MRAIFFRRFTTAGLFALLGVIVVPAHAQTSAGQLLQQNRELEPQPPILPEATREAAPVEIKPLTPKPGQLSFTVKHFVFVGNSKLSNDDLQPIVGSLVRAYAPDPAKAALRAEAKLDGLARLMDQFGPVDTGQRS